MDGRTSRLVLFIIYYLLFNRGWVISGGHYDYKQHVLDDIADTIESDIENNNKTWDDGWGEVSGHDMPSDVIARMTIIKNELRKLSKLVHAADWLYSGDDSVKTFLKKFDEIYNGYE